MAEARYQEVIGNYLKPSTIAEDPFPAVTLTEGQEAQVNLSNVRQWLPADEAESCIAYVTFLRKTVIRWDRQNLLPSFPSKPFR